MKNLHKPLITIILLSSLALSGCLPVLVGGAIWHDAKENEQCLEVLSQDNFSQKLNIPTFRKHVADVCDMTDAELDGITEGDLEKAKGEANSN